MKRLFVLSAIAIVAMFSSSALANTEPPKRHGWPEDIALYGDVESVTMTTYEALDDSEDITQGDQYYKGYYFNEAGDVFYWESLYSFHASYGKTIYKYDSTGTRIEEAKYCRVDGTLLSMCAYKYNSAGNLTEATEYDSDGSLDRSTIYKYDASGNMIEEAKYMSDSSLYTN
ncbi:MAG: RHS repeat protein, partial [Alistipes sp.]|nr:RHS repeat protein [Alistipes sp.]